MIKINRQPTDPSFEQFSTWYARACTARSKLLREWLAEGSPAKWNAKLDEGLYREFRQVFLYEAFHRKCAYCETKLGDVSTIQVEHYRPKGHLSDDGLTRAHPGYFWLAYEWWNLLPTCNHCNTWHTDPLSGRRHEGKGTKFPILGTRVYSPSEDPAEWRNDLAVEEPLLLNPYLHQPEDHIDFDPDSGIPFSNTPHGKATIEVCDLRRTSLCERRREQGNNILPRIIFRMLESPAEPLVDPSMEHSLWLARLLQKRLSALSDRAAGISLAG